MLEADHDANHLWDCVVMTASGLKGALIREVLSKLEY